MNSRQNLTSESSRINLCITMGDPSGIGPAITFAAINKLKGLADFTVIGDKWVFDKIKTQNSKLKNYVTVQLSEEPRRRAGLNLPYGIVGALPRAELLQNYKFVDLHNVAHNNFSFGKIKAEYGRASIEYLDKALELIKTKEIDCLVTCPISKEAINKAGFTYGGHTEYLSARTDTKDTVMMLLNRQLKFSLVTRHIPLRRAPAEINRKNLHKTISLTSQALKKLFLIKEPRIVVCGLNPHASDNGLIGEEENEIIKPALQKLKRRIKNLFGPLSADVAVLKANSGEFDCVIAMYHDQALIPLKLYGELKGVNITLGLPFVRTSPLHGTAFDIAKNPSLADAGSLIEAIRLAVKCASNLKKD